MNSSGAVVLIVLLTAGLSQSQSNDGSCTMDGVTYNDGAVWLSMEGCQSCRCSSGLTFCVQTSSCQDLGQCGVIVTLPGACCPVCFGCVTPSGRKTMLNETWEEDDCTQCVCTEGQTKCQASLCRTACLKPRKVPGECCPVCDDDCHLQCHHGRKLDANGTELCECIKEKDADDAQTTSTDSQEKEDGKYAATIDNDINDINDINDVNDIPSRCPEVPCSRICPRGFQVDNSGCPVCKCQRCRSMARCEKKCAVGLVLDARGCPLCQCRSPPVVSPASVATQINCQTTNGTLYTNGQSWQVDQCTSCICHQGGATCTETTCPLPCHNPLFIEDQCCPICSNSDSGSNQQGDGRVTDGTTLVTVVIICVALVGGLMLMMAALALCVSVQCQRLQMQHQDNMTTAAGVKLTAVNRLRPKSTNLDYQYNLYLHGYRENPSSCWAPLTPRSNERAESSEGSRDGKEEGTSSQCSNSPLLMKAN